MASDLARVTLVRNPEYERNGLKSYVRALHKYGITPTIDGPYGVAGQSHDSDIPSNVASHGGNVVSESLQLVKRDAETGHLGKVPAEDIQNNSLYIAEVGIGTPQQILTLNFDTGSADTWSTLLPSDVKDGNHVCFDPTKSSTWQDTTGTWNITYGDESGANGTVGQDNLTVGGLVVKNQAIELATHVSAAFVNNKGDGLLGLSFGINNTVIPRPVVTPVENMILQEDIPPSAELFTVWLDNKTQPSFFTFGYIDDKALQGQQPFYTTIDNSGGAWLFDSSTASINGQWYDRSGNKAIADTGTTLCLVSDALCSQIYSAIPGSTKSASQQGWVFPTTTELSTLPRIALSVGDALFYVKPDDFAFQDLPDGTTYGGIQSRGKQDFDVLGCVFLRCIYAIFDQGNTRFGCTQRDLPLSSGVLETPSAHPEKLHELPPVPTDEVPIRPGKRRRLGILGCCRPQGSSY